MTCSLLTHLYCEDLADLGRWRMTLAGAEDRLQNKNVMQWLIFTFRNPVRYYVLAEE